MKNQKSKITLIASLIGLYLISAGITWAVFSFTKKGGTPIANTPGGLEGARSKLTAQLPKTEICPINGEKFTKPEKDIWMARRPMTVVIENHVDSRPQSGLSRADVVYEVIAEGGITRFLGVFYCGAAASEVSMSPIRSARIYLVNWAAEYGNNPLFLHVGGANNLCPECPGRIKPKGTVAKEVDAFKALEDMGWRNGQSGNDFDGGTNVGIPVVVRNQNRLSEEPAAWEHSVVASLDEAYKEGAKRGFEYKDSEGVAWDESFVTWKFKDEKKSASPQTSKISFKFWDNKPDYDVEWEYDAATNSYKRFNGGKAHIDWEFDKPQLTVKNLVVMFVDEKGPVDKEYHMFYSTIGEGEATIFQNGEVIEATWTKESATGRTKYFDKSGKEIEFVGGKIWIEALPTGNEVNY